MSPISGLVHRHWFICLIICNSLISHEIQDVLLLKVQGKCAKDRGKQHLNNIFFLVEKCFKSVFSAEFYPHLHAHSFKLKMSDLQAGNYRENKS